MTWKKTSFRTISSRATLGLAMLFFFLVPAPILAQDHGYCEADDHRHHSSRRYRERDNHYRYDDRGLSQGP